MLHTAHEVLAVPRVLQCAGNQKRSRAKPLQQDMLLQRERLVDVHASPRDHQIVYHLSVYPPKIIDSVIQNFSTYKR